MTDRLITADATRVSPADFLRALQGKPPLTEAERAAKEAERQAFIINQREENRRELEALRHRLCKLASPELQAEWRARWAIEDAQRDAIERRAA